MNDRQRQFRSAVTRRVMLIALSAAAVALIFVGIGPFAPAQPAVDAGTTGAARFMVVDVMVDSGKTPLAAYQMEIFATNAAVKIVGIEGGAPAAFQPPPYYDPQAMQGDHVVLGAFSTAAAEGLPRGSVRVASLHCLVTAATPFFNTTIMAAASSDGQPINIRVQVNPRSTP